MQNVITEKQCHVVLAGVESEIHITDISDVPSLQHTELVDAVLDTIHQQHGLSRSEPNDGDHLVRSEFLTNGARCYDDHSYVEYSTPAFSDTMESVAAVRAGDRIVRSAISRVQQSLEDRVQLLAVRNNTDHRGHSYGAHVNVRLSREGFERIFGDKCFFHGAVAPFFATLPLICGAGRVSCETVGSKFLVWQRGPVIETLVSEATTMNRPLVNARDESLSADPDRYARLHVIHLDANRAEVAEYCKLGLLKLFGAAVDYLGWSGTSLELEDPICAVRSVTRSPFHPLRLKSGKTITPLGIQRDFFESFTRLFEQGAFDGRVLDAQDILRQVDEVLTVLERDPFDLVGSLDWITKFVWLDQLRSRHGLDWSDPRMAWADIQYHALTHHDGCELPQFRRLTSESQVQNLMDDAPDGSRAKIRGTIVRNFGSELGDIDWHWMVARDGQTAYALPDDPVDRVLESAKHAKTLDEFVRMLGLVPIPISPMFAVQLADYKDGSQETEFTHQEPLEEIKNV